MAPKSQAKLETKLLQFVHSRLEYMRCVQKTGEGLETATAQFSTSFAAHLSLIGHISHEVAVQIFDALQGSIMPAETVTACNLAVQAKVSLAVGLTASPVDNQRQLCETLVGYIQKGHWIAEHIDAAVVDHKQRFRSMAKFFRKLGLNHANEDAKALGCAICFHDATLGDTALLEGPHGYVALELFREALTNASVSLPGKDPLIYPTYKEFQTQKPLVVAGLGLPADKDEPLFDIANAFKIERIAAGIPRRSTNRNSGERTSHLKQAKPIGGGIRRQATQALTMLPSGPQQSDGTTPHGLLALGAAPPPHASALQLSKPTLALEGPQSGIVGSQPTLDVATPAADSAPQLPSTPQPQPDAVVPQTSPKTIDQMVTALQAHRATPKKGAAAPKKESPEKTATANKKPAVAAKPAAKTCNKKTKKKGRAIEVERSVKHVLARTGLAKGSGPGSKCFPYENEAGIQKAKNLAEKWLKSLGV